MAVSVCKLVQRGASGNRVRDKIALEDALQTTLRDDGRLVLVRRLQVSGHVTDPARGQHAVRRGWVEAVAGAMHGGNPAAILANCVWFASRGEAEAILLRKLLAGEPVEGWFWKLAIPNWNRAALNEWLRCALAECLSQNDAARFAQLAETCVEAGHADRLVEAIERALAVPDAPFGNPVPASIDPVTNKTTSSAIVEDILVERIAVKLTPLVLPLQWREMLARLERSDLPEAAKTRVFGAILQERIRRVSPALSLKPQLLERVAQATRKTATGRLAGSLAEALRSPDKQSIPSTATRNSAKPSQIDSHHSVLRRESLRDRGATAPFGEPVDPPQPRAEKLSEHSGLGALRASRHAGLWLVVPSLIRLGFREWLADQTEMLGENPGRSLILAVALHHRVTADDPVLAMFAPIEEDEQLPDWSATWRIGLDRWLRRTADRRTHDLVSRAGSLATSEERIDIHFPLDAADLNLRRRALDCDPGWTDWLGLSVRYHFAAAGSE